MSPSQISANADVRSVPLCARGGWLWTAALYKLCTHGVARDEHVDFVLRNSALSRVRFFAWLLVKGRIQSRSNLLRKGILGKAGSRCPICDAPLETQAHIMFECDFARNFWSMLRAAPVETARPVAAASTFPLHPSAPDRTGSTLLLLCLWHLWKHTNGVVFNGLTPSLSLVCKNCRDDAIL
jgi:hypothetical protein